LGIGTTNATNITIGHNAGTFAVDGTNFDIATSGRVTLQGAVSGGDILTQGTNALGIDTGGAAAINIGATNANAINIGRASGGGAVTITANAASTWSTTTGNLSIQAAGTSNLNLNTGGAGAVNLGATNTATVQIGGTTATTSVVLQAGSAASNGVAVQSSSATAFRVQNGGASSTLLTADASASRRVTVGTVGTIYGTSGSNGDLVVVGNAEVQGVLYFGNSSNDAIYTSSAGGPLRFKGTARNGLAVTLTPEYAGAVMSGDGSNNTGIMTSDFCSNSSPAINTGVCPTGGDKHNYYSWTANASNDYDVYVRYQLPSNFGGFNSATSISMNGFRSSSNGSVDLTLYNASGGVCGAANTTIASSNGAWTNNTLTSLTSDSDCTSMAAGDVITFVVHMNIGGTGVSGTDFARAGEISIGYYGNF
jgi:hypothetical protein